LNVRFRSEKESDIQASVVQAAEALGIQVVRLRSRFWPDRGFLLNNGVMVFIEFKQPGGTLTVGQYLRIYRVHHAGYKVRVYYRAEPAIQWLRSLHTEASAPARSVADVKKFVDKELVFK
jgi:hypothetical protein